MVTRDIENFVSRDWRAAKDRKDAYWAERIAVLGATEGLRIADELRKYVLELRPEWPSDENRAEDLCEHIRMSAMFRRVAPAFRR